MILKIAIAYGKENKKVMVRPTRFIIQQPSLSSLLFCVFLVEDDVILHFNLILDKKYTVECFSFFLKTAYICH